MFTVTVDSGNNPYYDIREFYYFLDSLEGIKPQIITEFKNKIQQKKSNVGISILNIGIITGELMGVFSSYIQDLSIIFDAVRRENDSKIQFTISARYLDSSWVD